ncbi:MAG: hypothetical protein Q8P59_00455, partial [Dehalococcoidia bacterium]|nr:hypothetical protein [Dehalococcoidia bacterium]
MLTKGLSRQTARAVQAPEGYGVQMVLRSRGFGTTPYEAGIAYLIATNNMVRRLSTQSSKTVFPPDTGKVTI